MRAMPPETSQPDLGHAVLGLVSSGAPGIAVAVALIIALWALLPRASRGHIRAPVALLVSHIAVLLAWLPLDPASSLARALRVLALFLLLAALGRAAFLLLIDVLLGGRLGRPLPRIFRDIVQALVYAGVVLVTLRGAGVEPGSLLTTSALLTAVVGLSLQDTLGNLFAGLAMQAQRPFEVGDWIQYDPDPSLIGRVIEINWRATTVLTLDEVELIIPNGALAKAPIKNFTKPSPLARRMIQVQAPYEISPRRVEEALRGAAHAVPGVRTEPAAFVLTKEFADSGITYQLLFYIDNFAQRDRIESAVRQRVWFAFQRAGITIPFPIRTVHVHAASAEADKRAEDDARALRLASLRGVDFLATLPQDALERLAALSQARQFMAGEMVIRQGDTGHELFIIQSGEVTVLVGRSDGSVAEVARLGPGKFFGEMSLMTGEPRSATIQATRDCELVMVDKASFRAILAAAPHLAERITEVLVERQAALEENLSHRAVRSQADKAAKSSALLDTIRQFFALRQG